MIEVKIQGVKYPIPSSIEDVSIERFIEFRNIDPSDILKRIYWSLGCYVKFDDTNTIERELANVLNITDSTVKEIYSFLNDKSKRSIPKEINLFKETFKIKDGLLNELPYWPYVVTKKIVVDNINNDGFDPTDDIPRVLAHYLYSYVTKLEYTEAAAEKFVEIINDIPMKEAIQLGNFFLSKHQSLFPRNKKHSKLKLIRSTSKQE